MHLKCDVCGKEFEHRFFSHIEKASHHACSKACQAISQRKGGKLDQKKRCVFLERYGVENPQQVKAFREATQRTNLVRYGTQFASQSTIVKDRITQTNLKRFGVKWHTQSTNFADKAQETWREHYGVDHPMQSDVVKAKHDFHKTWAKAHLTKKLNGTYASSRSENEFHQRLERLFERIERQVTIEYCGNVWLVDFKVGDMYVQFDGVYWHGLDRSIDDIRASNSKRDHAIIAAYDKDRVQDAWFKAHDMTLVRITDRQAKTLSDAELIKLLTPVVT